MDLSALADFNLVATHGGFGRAARASGRAKATLSRRVSELEASLGARLIERGERSLRLTEAGALLHARTGPLLSEIAEAGAVVGGGLDRPRGRLRVSAPLLLSDTQLGRVAADFARAYPEVELEICAEDRFVDPIEEGFDVIIRVNPEAGRAARRALRPAGRALAGGAAGSPAPRYVGRERRDACAGGGPLDAASGGGVAGP